MGSTEALKARQSELYKPVEFEGPINIIARHDR